ncbi:MAG: phosphodiester glycosidase family protein [Proteobacteria bacterium]|nr:phosphodiester glycosidase family protein [Pseudomonadota bacterium]
MRSAFRTAALGLRAFVTQRKRLALTLSFLAIAWLGLALYEKALGTSILVAQGGLAWIPVDEHTPWLDRNVRLAMHRPAPVAVPGRVGWRALAPGFEIAELPALAGGEEVDRVFLARIDPARFRFVVRNDRRNRTPLSAWMRRLNAALVVNGSYFARTGLPATPTVMDGQLLGPSAYTSTHAAFVSTVGHAEIRDLANRDWRAEMAGAQTAFVSFPLLIARDGSTRVAADSGWLANRSFVGGDGTGHIIIGTTRGAFFTLNRFAAFLRAAPLDLKMALNLDGGPVACQGVHVGGTDRRTYGRWELQMDARGQGRLLAVKVWREEPMPIVLAVLPMISGGRRPADH